MRRICVVTGSRADWGLLQPVHERLQGQALVDLVATWDCPEYDYRINFEAGDTEIDIAAATGGYVGYFAVHYSEQRPDLVVLLGDRYEIFAAAIAAHIARIPIAHIHGGESTEGAIDEAFRHSITKMAQLHFVAAEEYRKRVIQLGEQPERVFNFGGLGVDVISNTKLLPLREVEERIGYRLLEDALLVVFHPVTQEDSAAEQTLELLDALQDSGHKQLIFINPNADTGNGSIRNLIRLFVRDKDGAHVHDNIDSLTYLSLLSYVDGIVGNSSSGLLEAPSMRKGCVNIGDRQKGRLKASSVIDCEPTRASICAAIEKLYSPEFQESLKHVVNPYGCGGACELIVKILCEHPLDNILKKSFYDLPQSI